MAEAAGTRSGTRTPPQRHWIRPRSWSLAARLFLSHAAVLLLGGLILWIGFLGLLVRSARVELSGIEPMPLLAANVALMRQAGLPSTVISESLRVQAAPDNARIAVVDADGHVLVDTAPQDGSLPWATIGARAVDGGSAAYDGVVKDGEGRRWFYTVAQSHGTEPKSTVIAARLGADIRPTLRSVLEPLVLAQLLSITAAGAAGALLARSVARPIRRIIQGMEAVARGREGGPLHVEREDEVGRLVATFNDMATAVHHSDRALREGMSSISHDLHTPLTSIHGWAEVMADRGRGTDPVAQRAGEAILEVSLRMERLIDEMLLLSRIEGGALPIHRTPVDVRTLLTVAQQRAPVPERCLVRQDESDLAIDIDPDQFSRVLDNLVSNAFRYSPPDRPIELGGRAVAQQDAVALWVADEGSGVAEDEKVRIFDRFYQTEGARNGGTAGIGLAIARGIVEAHGGSIYVEDNIPHGARFVVLIPRT